MVSKTRKVMIWIGSSFREVEVTYAHDENYAIARFIRDEFTGYMGEVVPEDDRQWGGYRRIEIYISPPVCQSPECFETLRSDDDGPHCSSCTGEE